MSSEATGRNPALLDWYKSSYSSGEGGACVEVAVEAGVVHIRDSKNTQLPHLSVGASEWAAFVDFVAGR